MRVFSGSADLIASIGEDVGASSWLEVTQERIDKFADATGDHQWIHVDPERAAAGPFGGTVAHGYLTLSLMVPFMHEVYRIDDRRHAVNYGVNRVRFPAPLRAGSRTRGRFVLAEVEQLDGAVQIVWKVTFEVQGSDRPACVAESITRVYF
jgi:acyl dehydratase